MDWLRKLIGRPDPRQMVTGRPVRMPSTPPRPQAQFRPVAPQIDELSRRAMMQAGAGAAGGGLQVLPDDGTGFQPLPGNRTRINGQVYPGRYAEDDPNLPNMMPLQVRPSMPGQFEGQATDLQGSFWGRNPQNLYPSNIQAGIRPLPQNPQGTMYSPYLQQGGIPSTNGRIYEDAPYNSSPMMNSAPQSFRDLLGY